MVLFYMEEHLAEEVLHENIYVIKIHKLVSTSPLLAMICADSFQSPSGKNKLSSVCIYVKNMLEVRGLKLRSTNLFVHF